MVSSNRQTVVSSLSTRLTRQSPAKPRGFWSSALRRLLRNRLAIVGLLLLVVLLLLTSFAELISPYDPIAQSRDAADRLSPPSADHPMGTDELRRDVFSRVLHGGRTTIQVGVISVSGATIVGIILGMCAGYYGGWIDDVISRFLDIVLTLPGILLAIAIVAILGASLQNAMLAIAVSTTPAFARLVRSVTLVEKNKVYIESCRALGASDLYILSRHIFPNVIPALIVVVTLNVASAIQIAAGLSFLGLGAQPPDPEWGSMLSNGRDYIRTGEWWMTVFPGVAILITVLSINLVGDALRSALDPRMRGL